MSSKLELPNPGGKRFWEIHTDSEGDFVLTLRGQFGSEISRTLIYRSDAGDGEFIYQANLLVRANAAQVKYTGTYKFEEN